MKTQLRRASVLPFAVAMGICARSGAAQCDEPWFEPRIVPSRPVVAIDADGSGWLEIASKDDDGLAVWTLDAGAIPLRATAFAGVIGSDFDAADFTGDGADDLAVITLGPPRLRILAKTGGDWTVISSIPAVDGRLFLFDHQGDSDPDVLIAGADSVQVYTNTGAGIFALGVPLVESAVSRVWPADVNGDGLDDLVLGFHPNTTVAYLQQPDGSFTAGPSVAIFPDLVGDLDGDGLADLLAGPLLHPGVGDGTFGQATLVLDQNAEPELLADIDSDGDLDVAAIEQNIGDLIYLNDGIGSFTRRVSEPRVELWHPQARDMDGDGNLDLLNEVRAGVAIIRGRGDGTFHLPQRLEAFDFIRRLVASDLDADGDMDAVAVGEGVVDSGPGIVFLDNSGAGRMEIAAAQSMNGSVFEAPVAGDFDGDGDADVAAWSDNEILLFENTPDGHFSTRRSLDAPDDYFAIQLFASDLDGNGLTDLVLLDDHVEPAVRIEFSHGRWSFTRTVIQSTHPFPIGVADMTSDGIDDLILLNRDPLDPQIAVLRGLGNGTFGALIASETRARYVWIYPGDFDGDGDADLLGVGLSGPSIALLRNDGAGRLEDRGTVASYASPRGIGVADLNADGLDDFVTGTQLDQDNAAFLLSNGDGTFSKPIPLWLIGGLVTAAPADMNGDGAPDLVLAHNIGSAGVVTVMLNQCGGAGCPVDLNHDRFVNTIDVIAFLQLWAGRFPAADWNQDGLVNTIDLAAFLADWTTGCP